MGFGELLLYIIVVAILAAVANWILGQIPGVPAILPKIIWILAVVIVLWLLLTATGILSHDVRIPRVG